MLIIGLGDTHDAGVALLQDGRILWSSNEERFSRVKLQAGFPHMALACCLADCGITLRDVGGVCFGGYGLRRDTGLRNFNDASARENDPSARFLDGPMRVNLRRPLWPRLRRFSPSRRESLRVLWAAGYRGPVDLYAHHHAHAASAYYTSGHDEATVITIDGGGDGLAGSVWRGQAGQILPLAVMPRLHSAGDFWGAITELCGFSPTLHGGKITGLAAGSPCPEAREVLETFYGCDTDRLTWINRKRLGPQEALAALRNALDAFAPAQIAWAAQKVLEANTAALVAAAIRETGCGNLNLAGGVFANVRLNQVLHELPEVEDIYIYPHMGDGGLAMGAALLGEASRRPLPSRELETACLGTRIDESAIAAQATEAGLIATKLDAPAAYIADRLAAKQVVGLVQGRAEYGPRALGHRSILAEPTDPTMMDWLNDRLERTEFMPFAPVVTEEKAGAYFRGYPRGRQAARFMTLCFDATDLARQQIPGAVHVDGTARPQVVARDAEPLLHAVLCGYEERTGLGACINTSFNRHEEPIVNTAREAMAELLAGRVDALVIAPYAIERPAEGA